MITMTRMTGSWTMTVRGMTIDSVICRKGIYPIGDGYDSKPPLLISQCVTHILNSFRVDAEGMERLWTKLIPGLQIF